MSRRCCDGSCNQGRDCPLRAARILTGRRLTVAAVGLVFYVAGAAALIVGRLG